MEEKKYFLDVVINKEKLSDGKDIYVAQCSSLGVTSQGSRADGRCNFQIRENFGN